METTRSADRGGVRFEEVQRFRQFYLLLVMGAVNLLALGVVGFGAFRQLVQGVPFGDRPVSDGALLWIFGAITALVVGLDVLVLAMRLEVRVLETGLSIRFRPFVRREIPWSDLRGFHAVVYRPVAEYGGWGIRGWGRNKAYNVSGNRGVRLLLADDYRLLIGSQRPEELERAIAEASGRAPEAGENRPA